MKISEIKTMHDYWKVCDIWRNRSFKLLYIWIDDNETIKRRQKAGKLWDTLVKRVLKLNNINNENK
jgi:hypothetical protein